jgi:hypothetical protein
LYCQTGAVPGNSVDLERFRLDTDVMKGIISFINGKWEGIAKNSGGPCQEGERALLFQDTFLNCKGRKNLDGPWKNMGGLCGAD